MNQILDAIASDPNISPAFKAAVCPQRRHNDPRPDVPTEAEPDADELAAGRALVTFDATAFCRQIGRAE